MVTWRIIPVSKWLVTRVYKPLRPFATGNGDLLTMVITHLLTGMILQVSTRTHLRSTASSSVFFGETCWDPMVLQ